jgi:DNA-binding response OmpR family regulator
MEKILIVEDEKSINDLLLINLKLVGYECRQAFDGNEAIAALETFNPDLILLDIMIPYIDGFDLMRQKALKNIPVIFVTAKDNIADRVAGLKLGADDYIIKPFEAIELLARVEAVLRRTNPVTRTFTIGKTSIHLDKRVVTVDDVQIDVTKREFEVLEVLVRNRNLALSREKLIELAWGHDYYGDMRTVDVHITKLRKKLQLENHIKTVFKHGYRLET